MDPELMTTLTGVVTGQTIALDERVPELEGKRVRVLLEPADESGLAGDQAVVWREWAEHGPHGPIDDDGEADFP
jgi:hypothetical protein